MTATGRHYVIQAIIGSKTEPYYPGEDFDYKPPTYIQILKEYGEDNSALCEMVINPLVKSTREDLKR